MPTKAAPKAGGSGKTKRCWQEIVRQYGLVSPPVTVDFIRSVDLEEQNSVLRVIDRHYVSGDTHVLDVVEHATGVIVDCKEIERCLAGRRSRSLENSLIDVSSLLVAAGKCIVVK